MAATSACTPEAWIRAVWPDEVEDQAVEVAWCESRLDPEAVSASGTYLGLFQMHRRYHAHRPGMDQPLTPWGNAMAALDLYMEQGWRPWSCRP